jgi:hypothetical protein
VSDSDYFPNTLTGWPSLQIQRTSCIRAINIVTLLILNSRLKVLKKAGKITFTAIFPKHYILRVQEFFIKMPSVQ